MEDEHENDQIAPRRSLRLALSEINNESTGEATPSKNTSADELLVLQRGPRRKPITWSPVEYDSLNMNTTKVKNDPDIGGTTTGAADTNKSSMQILSELFSTFDAEPPVIVKKEKKEKSSESSKKSKKSKKKRKHKEKKHKKKSKKKKRSTSSSSSSSSESEIDLAKLLIKQEKDKADEKIKIEGTSLSLDIKLEINKEEQKIKPEKGEKSDKNSRGDSKQKIHIKEVQLSSLQHEEGEITESDSDTRKKKKHKSKDKEKSKKRKSVSRERSRSNEKKSKHDDTKYRGELSPELEKYRHKSHHETRDFLRSSHRTDNRRSRERSRSKERYRDDYRSRYRDKEYPQHRDDGFYKSRDRSRSKSRDRISSRSKDRWLMRDRYRSLERKRPRDNEESSRIDKKKLLEIARRNAIQMMKSGSLPGALTLGSIAQEKMIAAIKSGGKTIAELTDFCKSLSRKEELGELSSLSEKEESDTDEPFHHPFKIKDRPTTITMNIKNSVPLPVKTTHERTTELRMQFPVSSGQQHRVNEEWVPVSPPHPKPAPIVELPKPKIAEAPSAPLAIEPPPPLPPPLKAANLGCMPPPPEPTPVFIPAPPNAPPGPQVFPTASPLTDQPPVDISSIVSQRLTAMRKLQENPHDVQALNEMYKSNKEMETWAKSKQQLGQFTGTTGAQVMSQAELASGYQAWAKRDQLQTAAPVSGGMGMHLLQKMGWKPGEGLGKEKTGALEPLLLEVKLDKKGLVATEEQSKGKKKLKVAQTVKTLQGKHPVSLLGEYASKRKLGAPQYILDFECGPDHKKNFVFKVVLNGVEYRPNVASANKKEAKANAATLALKEIGLIV